jgi:high-affinity nickel-transport protein
MQELQSTPLWATLGLLFALGFRHGLDPDHIAAVDGLTRMRCKDSRFLSARLTGFQFASGHSLTVFLATLIFYWQGVALPLWLDNLGLWISSSFLIWLAWVNFKFFLAREPAHRHSHSSLKTMLFKWLGPLAHPMGVGFAFALSFDTLAQAGLMAHKGHELGGFAMIVYLSFCFGSGMMLADSLNGLVVHWMVQRSQAMAEKISRLISALIATLSLTVVAIEQGRDQWPVVNKFWDTNGALLSMLSTSCLLCLVWYFKSRNRVEPLTQSA